MAAKSQASLEKWARTIPSSRMVYPPELKNRFKYALWRVVTPIHPYVRDVGQALGLARIHQKHAGRQDFLLGTVPKESIEPFIKFLLQKGFGNHFIAWKDQGEVVSLRLVNDFTYQYHVRVFEDGEVRGHYEYTPECRPWLHLKAIGQEHRKEEFSKLLQEWESLR